MSALAQEVPFGLCGCGCQQPTNVCTKTSTRDGHRRGQPFRFLPGHHLFGHEISRETRAKIAAKHRGKKLSPEHRQKLSAAAKARTDRKRGDEHHSWLGDQASYRAIHGALSARHPKTGICERCRGSGKTSYAFLKHPKPHTRERSDYAELCWPCHRKADNALRRQLGISRLVPAA